MKRLIGPADAAQLRPPCAQSLGYASVQCVGKWRSLLRRRWRYAAAALVGTALLAFAAFLRHRPWIWYGSQKAYDVHLYMTCATPKGTVAYDDDPARVAAIASGPDKIHYAIDRFRSEIHYQNDLFRLVQWKAEFLFLHGRTAPNGYRRLVALGYGAGHLVYGSYLHVDWRVLADDRSTLNFETSLIYAQGDHLCLYAGQPHSDDGPHFTGKSDRLRLYTGQPDPNDDSHFTIKYQIGNRPGTIDGWLQSDDSVKLQIRDGPATKP
jgi:hypothetical protein